MIQFRSAASALLLILVAACSSNRGPVASGVGLPPSTTQNFVVAANPIAAEAGMAILRRGGSAVDAAIAVQAMLSLVEPQSSGLGGGAFLTYFDGSSGKVIVYDGRETAPAGAREDMFLDAEGKTIPFRQVLTSGRATGVPGVVKMLSMAHEEHGTTPWADLFGDAERLAREGFVITPRLARFLEGSFPQVQAADAKAYFSNADGQMKKAGDRLVNASYADFLQRLSRQGPGALYTGETAQRLITRVSEGPLPGSMTLADLQSYQPLRREALCNPYRVYVVCVPPPPSSGVALLQLLSMVEKTDIDQRGPNDPQAWFLFAEASRLMYADRDRYIGDPAFTSVPVSGLLDGSYVAERAALIGSVAGPAPQAGTPPGARSVARDSTAEPAGTSHFIVGDARGNVASITTTVESIFGTGRMVDGFFLNNQLTDFAFTPRDGEGRLAANAIAAGKRPRSSMSPLIMIDSAGRFAGAMGSAGGNAILAYVGKSLIAAVDWNLPTQDALGLPNLVARGTSFQGEASKFSPEVLNGLKALKVEVRPGQGEDSGVHAVIVRDGKIDGGYDPRREGVVLVEAPQR